MASLDVMRSYISMTSASYSMTLRLKVDCDRHVLPSDGEMQRRRQSLKESSGALGWALVKMQVYDLTDERSQPKPTTGRCPISRSGSESASGRPSEATNFVVKLRRPCPLIDSLTRWALPTSYDSIGSRVQTRGGGRLTLASKLLDS